MDTLPGEGSLPMEAQKSRGGAECKRQVAVAHGMALRRSKGLSRPDMAHGMALQHGAGRAKKTWPEEFTNNTWDAHWHWHVGVSVYILEVVKHAYFPVLMYYGVV